MAKAQDPESPSVRGDRHLLSSWRSKVALALSVLLFAALSGTSFHTFHRQKYLSLNAGRLGDLSLSTRISAHRVNQKSTARELLSYGVRSWEVDIRYDSEANSFVVGHDSGESNGSLEAYLELDRFHEVKGLWLDVKNLGKSNCDAALIQLETLDRRFNIKHRSIVESSTKSSCLRSFRKSNWYTSYYLPTRSIRDNRDAMGLDALAREIAATVKRQDTAAVSFDQALHPFVKRHLEPLLAPDVEYHLWDLSLNYYDAALLKKLPEKTYFHDARVKTILLPQHSLSQYFQMKRDRIKQLLSRL